MNNWLKQRRKLCDEATDGPWRSGRWSGQCHLNHQHGRGYCEYKYTFEAAEDDIYGHGWNTICMANEPVEHIITTEEYGALSKGDSKYIASHDPATMRLIYDVVEASIIELDSGDTWDLCPNNQEICPHCDKVKAIKALQNKVGNDESK